MADSPPVGRPIANQMLRLTGGSTLCGFTLTELVVTIAVVGALSASALTAMVSANQIGSVERTLTSARTLCQDRIEQVVSQPFAPTTTIPSMFGSWPVPSTDTVTTTETVPVYADTAGTVVINGTRTTIVSCPNTTLNYVLVTARVDYTYRGRSYRQEINTVRAPD